MDATQPTFQSIRQKAVEFLDSYPSRLSALMKQKAVADSNIKLNSIKLIRSANETSIEIYRRNIDTHSFEYNMAVAELEILEKEKEFHEQMLIKTIAYIERENENER